MSGRAGVVQQCAEAQVDIEEPVSRILDFFSSVLEASSLL